MIQIAAAFIIQMGIFQLGRYAFDQWAALKRPKMREHRATLSCGCSACGLPLHCSVIINDYPAYAEDLFSAAFNGLKNVKCERCKP